MRRRTPGRRQRQARQARRPRPVAGIVTPRRSYERHAARPRTRPPARHLPPLRDIRAPMRTRVALLLALLAAGCGGSDDNRFYRLVPVTSAAPVAGGSCSAPIAVAAVTVPDAVDRGEIVRASGPDEVDVSNHDRWAAPLSLLIQRTLAQDLQQRLPPGRVLGPDAQATAGGTATVRLGIKRFMADDDGDTSYGQISAGMSTAVGVLADRIAAVLAKCPG